MKIEQRKVQIIAFLPNHKVSGIIRIPKGGRFSDFINQPVRRFLPIREAKIYLTQTGELLHSVDFLVLNRDHILSIFPVEEYVIGEKGEE